MSARVRIWPIIATVSLLIILWVVFSLTALLLSRLIPEKSAFQPVFAFASLFFFVGFGSLATGIFVFYAAKTPLAISRMRPYLLALCVVVFAGLYLFTRFSGGTDSIVVILATANLLVFANLLGTWIVAPLRRPAELVMVCVVMSLADIYSVAGGPTKKIAEGVSKYYEGGMQGPAPLSDFLLVKIPVPGQSIPVPVFGVADWIIIAFLAAAVARFGIDDNIAGKSLTQMIDAGKPAIYLPIAAVGLCVGVVIAGMLNMSLPALPIIAAIFLAYVLIKYPAARKLRNSDWIVMLLFAAAITALFAARWFGLI